jgi:RNA polymerase sigma-70 factor (sigma-E family)
MIRPACKPEGPARRATSVTGVMTRAERPPGSAWDADDAVEQLYAAHYRSLVRLAVLLLRDQGAAEDVVQDSFVAMHGRWRRLREPDHALAYLRQTVVNRARSVLRHRGVEDRYAPVLAADTRGVAADPAEAGVRRDAVLGALQQLPTRQREVLVLRYYLDLDEAAIADALGISRGAVKSHASRGAAALREHLGPATGERQSPEDLR